MFIVIYILIQTLSCRTEHCLVQSSSSRSENEVYSFTWFPCSGSLVLIPLFWFPCSGSLVLIPLFWFWFPCSGFPVLVPLFWFPCSDSLVDLLIFSFIRTNRLYLQSYTSTVIMKLNRYACSSNTYIPYNMSSLKYNLNYLNK